MEPAEITDVISRLPDGRCSVSGDWVRIFVPAIDDSVCLRTEDGAATGLRGSTAARGRPALGQLVQTYIGSGLYL